MAQVKTATRRISNSGQRRCLVLPATAKAVGELPTESMVEYDGILTMVFDVDIVTIEVQPETVPLQVGASIRRYTPDVRFSRRDGRIGYREFKHDVASLDLGELETLRAAASHFRRRGYEFSIVDSKELRSGFMLENVKLLKRYSTWSTSETFARRVEDYVHGGERRLGEVRDFVGHGGLGALYRMLWEQRLRFDASAELLNGATRIWAAER